MPGKSFWFLNTSDGKKLNNSLNSETKFSSVQQGIEGGGHRGKVSLGVVNTSFEEYMINKGINSYWILLKGNHSNGGKKTLNVKAIAKIKEFHSS